MYIMRRKRKLSVIEYRNSLDPNNFFLILLVVSEMSSGAEKENHVSHRNVPAHMPGILLLGSNHYCAWLVSRFTHQR